MIRKTITLPKKDPYANQTYNYTESDKARLKSQTISAQTTINGANVQLQLMVSGQQIAMDIPEIDIQRDQLDQIVVHGHSVRLAGLVELNYDGIEKVFLAACRGEVKYDRTTELFSQSAGDIKFLGFGNTSPMASARRNNGLGPDLPAGMGGIVVIHNRVETDFNFGFYLTRRAWTEAPIKYSGHSSDIDAKIYQPDIQVCRETCDKFLSCRGTILS